MNFRGNISSSLNRILGWPGSESIKIANNESVLTGSVTICSIRSPEAAEEMLHDGYGFTDLPVVKFKWPVLYSQAEESGGGKLTGERRRVSLINRANRVHLAYCNIHPDCQGVRSLLLSLCLSPTPPPTLAFLRLHDKMHRIVEGGQWRDYKSSTRRSVGPHITYTCY